MFIALGFIWIALGYWCLRTLSPLDMEQAAMLPFADDRPAALRVEQATARPCLPEHLAVQSILPA